MSARASCATRRQLGRRTRVKSRPRAGRMLLRNSSQAAAPMQNERRDRLLKVGADYFSYYHLAIGSLVPVLLAFWHRRLPTVCHWRPPVWSCVYLAAQSWAASIQRRAIFAYCVIILQTRRRVCKFASAAQTSRAKSTDCFWPNFWL